MKSLHYWRIHARVTKRVWTDLDVDTREILANDVLHLTSVYQWFEAKVNADTERLYSDPDYYDNAEFSFRVSKIRDL